MIPYAELREQVQTWPKHPGTKSIVRAPLIHEGFPGQFNISFSEYHWLQEYGNYVNFDHDYCISTIQSCIRLNDFSFINENEDYKYLGVFELSDVYGALTFSTDVDYSGIHLTQIKNFVDFLVQIGIPKNSVYASYCTGGSVSMLTKEKYIFPFIVPEDVLSKKAFLDAGVSEENLIPDASRNTFLALHLYRPTPWGYRNEIFVDLGKNKQKKLLDVGTAEFIFYKPIYKSDESRAENIIGLEERTKLNFFVTGVGLERLCMAANDLERVHDVDYIKPFYDYLENQTGKRDFLVGESLRALHRICSDILKYNISALSKNRRYKINGLARNVLKARLTSMQIKDLLSIHSQTQPWHPELEKGIDFTIKKIEIKQNGVICGNAQGAET